MVFRAFAVEFYFGLNEAEREREWNGMIRNEMVFWCILPLWPFVRYTWTVSRHAFALRWLQMWLLHLTLTNHITSRWVRKGFSNKTMIDDDDPGSLDLASLMSICIVVPRRPWPLANGSVTWCVMYGGAQPGQALMKGS